MILVITHTGFYLNDGEPDVFVDDNTFLAITNSKELQELLLDGKDVVSVGRVGIANSIGFWKKDIAEDSSDLAESYSYRRELGYYAKL